jgi:membrane-associated phospholipid phosphatase
MKIEFLPKSNHNKKLGFFFHSPMSCEPLWYKAGLECPYGNALPLEVTYPNNPDFWELSCVIYGYVPWGISFLIGLLFLIYRGTREIALGITIGLSVGISEIIKASVEQARPLTSCLHTCGMPSSHAAVSMGMLTFLVLDAAYRIVPPAGRTNLWSGWEGVSDTSKRFTRGLTFLTFNPVSQYEFFLYFLIWTFALLPVPIARVIVGDHTPKQTLAGGIVGWGVGLIWFPICVVIRKALRAHVGKKFLWIFVHNYDVPVGWTVVPENKSLEPSAPEGGIVQEI